MKVDARAGRGGKKWRVIAKHSASTYHLLPNLCPPTRRTQPKIDSRREIAKGSIEDPKAEEVA
jgi:hypothetical protein